MTAPRIHVPVLAGAALLAMSTAGAVERVVLDVNRVTFAGGGEARSATATLRLTAAGQARLEAGAAQLRLTAGVELKSAVLACRELVVREPEFACRGGTLRAQLPGIGELTAQLQASLDEARGHAQLELGAPALAGGSLQLAAQATGMQWRLRAAGTALQLSALRALLPAQALPEDLEVAGKLGFELSAHGVDADWRAASVAARIDDLAVQNAAGTLASEGTGATLDVALRPQAAGTAWSLRIEAARGQILAGPVLLDFGAQPLSLHATGHLTRAALTVDQAEYQQPGLIAASLRAQLALAPALQLQTASVEIAQLQFPAAYTSFMQLALAATELGTLKSRGSVSGHLEWRDGGPRACDAVFSGLEFDDRARRLALRGIDGHLQWDAADGPARSSGIAWQSVELYGIQGAAGALALRAHGDAFTLLQPARIPLFDGALLLRQLELASPGTPALRLTFAADIEPIGMDKLSAAFGWPPMAGRLSGRIPGLVYRDRTLAFDGDLHAEVFDGTVTARHLRLIDPLGVFPRLAGDFEARRLDLDLITHTFPIGSISGRLDADIRRLELFGWSPVAFDAHLYTSPGDRTRHRISQKAVDSLANLGGGGGVMGALQSGFLQFFKNFGYDRIGLSCQLRDDVCLMGGIPRREGGFYIVRGGGLPRIDVVANSGRVAWSRLVGQVLEAIQRGGVQVGDAQADAAR